MMGVDWSNWFDDGSSAVADNTVFDLFENWKLWKWIEHAVDCPKEENCKQQDWWEAENEKE
jgi:hypothetical protein